MTLMETSTWMVSGSQAVIREVGRSRVHVTCDQREECEKGECSSHDEIDCWMKIAYLIALSLTCINHWHLMHRCDDSWRPPMG